MGHENAEGMAHVGVRLTDQLGQTFDRSSLCVFFEHAHSHKAMANSCTGT